MKENMKYFTLRGNLGKVGSHEFKERKLAWVGTVFVHETGGEVCTKNGTNIVLRNTGHQSIQTQFFQQQLGEGFLKNNLTQRKIIPKRSVLQIFVQFHDSIRQVIGDD